MQTCKIRKRLLLTLTLATLLLIAAGSVRAGLLDDLAKPQEGRSMRATSTMRVGEVRRAGGQRGVRQALELERRAHSITRGAAS